MDRALRNLIRNKAGNRCEYCDLPQECVGLARFHIEHIISKQHGGEDDPTNPCLSCARCNLSKGPNLSGIDSVTDEVVLLFHPRRQKWKRHFRWSGPKLVGLAKTGRAPIAVLNINHPQRIKLRRRLMEQGEFFG